MFENLSNQRKLNLFFVFASVFLLCFIYLITKPDNSGDKFTIADIKLSIDGKVIKKVDVRKGLFLHVKISRPSKSDTIVFLGQNVDSLEIGDRIIKKGISPFFYILKEGTKPTKYIYTYISETTLDNEHFPKAWKDSCRSSWKEVMISKKEQEEK